MTMKRAIKKVFKKLMKLSPEKFRAELDKVDTSTDTYKFLLEHAKAVIEDRKVCPVCQELRDMKFVIRKEKSIVRGTKVYADAAFCICMHCKEEFSTAEQMEYTLDNVFKEYKKMQEGKNV